MSNLPSDPMSAGNAPSVPREEFAFPQGAWRESGSRPPGPPKWRWLPWLLLAATCLTTTLAGFLLTPRGMAAADLLLSNPAVALDALARAGLFGALKQILQLLAGGLPYAAAILLFFFSHEMGHYFACRYHRTDCTLPFFLPGPPPIGTFGAVIRIRAPFPNRRVLFDIGIAGPLTGFAVMLPVLALGVLRMQAVPASPLPPQAESIFFGDSLLTKLLTHWLRPEVGPGADLLIDPIFLAGWFGMLATSMNLIPAGQFDGGHIFYALFPRWHRAASLLSGLLLLALVVGYGTLAHQFSAWTLWAVVVLVLGRKHPPVPNDGKPLGRARWVLAGIVLLVMLLCFMPHPVGTIRS